MLTANVNIKDRIVNGLDGKVMKFKLVNHQITMFMRNLMTKMLD